MMRNWIAGLTLFSTIIYIGAPGLAVASGDVFSQLVVADDLSPEERLTKKIELTENALGKAAEKAQVMQNDLASLDFPENSLELELKNRYSAEVTTYITFYQEQRELLKGLTTIEEVDNLISSVISYRESTYAPGAKTILEFILVFSYGPSILNTAKERLESIGDDLEKLAGLELIDRSQFAAAIEQAQTTLGEAESLQAQAQSLLLSLSAPTATSTIATSTEATSTTATGTVVTSTVPAETPAVYETSTTETATSTEAVPVTPPTPQKLTEESLNKIKGLYDVFIETSRQVREALGV